MQVKWIGLRHLFNITAAGSGGGRELVVRRAGDPPVGLRALGLRRATVILLRPPLPSSRCFNSDGEGASAK